IGNRLGRIILRAMAAQPGDRFPNVGEMVIALESYLEESGLAKDKIPGELARYFQAPVPYEAALKARLLDHLTRRGQELMGKDDRAGALDAFDRVLTIDPENAKVLAILDGINRRTKLKHVGIATLAIVAIGGGAFAINEKAKVAPETPQFEGPPVHVELAGRAVVAHDDQPPPAPIDAAEPDAAPAVVIAPRLDAGRVATSEPDGGSVLAPVDIAVKVVQFSGSQYRLDRGRWQPVTSDTILVRVDKPVEIEVQNPSFEEVSQTLTRDSKNVMISMQLRPASVVAKCPVKTASVEIDGQSWKLDDAFTIKFDKNATSSKKTVKVRFIDKEIDAQDIEVNAGKLSEVTCALH
ncbi:MAG: hypothetical protein ACM31C_23650, partial [Acidobacteriota bacterium]